MVAKKTKRRAPAKKAAKAAVSKGNGARPSGADLQREVEALL